MFGVACTPIRLFRVRVHIVIQNVTFETEKLNDRVITKRSGDAVSVWRMRRQFYLSKLDDSESQVCPIRQFILQNTYFNTHETTTPVRMEFNWNRSESNLSYLRQLQDDISPHFFFLFRYSINTARLRQFSLWIRREILHLGERWQWAILAHNWTLSQQSPRPNW